MSSITSLTHHINYIEFQNNFNSSQCPSALVNSQCLHTSECYLSMSERPPHFSDTLSTFLYHSKLFFTTHRKPWTLSLFQRTHKQNQWAHRHLLNCPTQLYQYPTQLTTFCNSQRNLRHSLKGWQNFSNCLRYFRMFYKLCYCLHPNYRKRHRINHNAHRKPQLNYSYHSTNYLNVLLSFIYALHKILWMFYSILLLAT